MEMMIASFSRPAHPDDSMHEAAAAISGKSPWRWKKNWQRCSTTTAARDGSRPIAARACHFSRLSMMAHGLSVPYPSA